MIQELSWYFGNHGFNGECCDDLSLVEFIALKNIHEKNNSSIQSIGKAINITKSGATKIIDRLEGKGYVVRENSAIDGRVCCVNLTNKGKEAILKITGVYISYIEGVLSDFNPQNIKKIKDTLEMLIKALREKDPFRITVNSSGGSECN